MTGEPRAADRAALAEWDEVAVRYPYAKEAAVGPVRLAIGRGERVLLLGASGSGKSTLLMTLTGLMPVSIPAEVAGYTRLRGEPVSNRSPAGWADTVAHLFQDADRTLCGMRVEDEIAFALENAALPEACIQAKILEAMHLVGLPQEWRSRRSTTLSGGERQLVALAAALAQEAPLLVADEPTAHLAPAAAAQLYRLLLDNRRMEAALIVDHRLDGLIGVINRVAVLGDDGRIVAQGPPAALFREQRERLDALGVWRPLASHLDAELSQAGLAPAEPPLSIDAVLRHLEDLPPEERSRARDALASFASARRAAPPASHGRTVARLTEADCAPFLGPTVLRKVNLEIREGEVLGLLGANGAGKTTLGGSLAGLLRLKGGSRDGAAGAIALQKPEHHFTAASVREELSTWLKADALRLGEILARWGLDGLEERHPAELSQGQKRRLALACLTSSSRWPLLVLDEPFAGLDARGAETVFDHIEALAAEGRAVALITHDMDLALRLCSRSIVLGENGILAEGPTAELLTNADLVARAGLAEPAIAPVLRWLKGTAAC
ncbi:ABC transporter ATP-binding protein [Arvimicrobium flavum]|uniref:ABC transporter ATP-binding protein n=1 Tax=Arvimicrobium flavum TaxID=3393320 RepID=UPI00237A19A5|nr:ATP-binding cassette domain-containing protein [Mesorhizobium shangrilense]